MEPRADPPIAKLQDALLAEARTEIIFVLRVAVMVAAGHRHADIARTLDARPQKIAAAVKRLRSIAPRLERG
jgi:hypothetical protein